MNTFLVASQIVCYGVGIFSASLNIANFVHRRVKRHRKALTRATTLSSPSADLSAYRLMRAEKR
jgi:hypothetical protein